MPALAVKTVRGPLATEAVSDWSPAEVPRVQDVVTSPSSLVAATAGLTDPAPGGVTKATATPATAELPMSAARTTSRSRSRVPTSPTCPSPETISRDVATCETVAVAVALTPFSSALTVPVPLDSAVALPSAPMERTAGASLVHDTAPSNAAPY